MSNNIIIIPTVTYINPYIDKKKRFTQKIKISQVFIDSIILRQINIM